MILDKISACECYKALSPEFRKAFEFLQTADFSNMENGRHPIDGDKVYVTVSEPALRDWDGGKWEAHRRYADIQAVLEGEEIIGYAPVTELTALAEFDSQRDFVPLAGEGLKVTLKAGEFAVFFPQDGHKPCVRSDRSLSRKAVIKVLLDK